MTTTPASTRSAITPIWLAFRPCPQRGDPRATDHNCRDTTDVYSYEELPRCLSIPAQGDSVSMSWPR
jgi:hypothetical protein